MAMEFQNEHMRIRLRFEADLLVTEFLSPKGDTPFATLKTRGAESTQVIAAIRNAEQPPPST